MNNIAIEISNLTKDFRIGIRGVKLRAVDNVSFSVSRGEIFGLLGPNGSGKSTTLKILLGLFKPTKGICSVFGTPTSDVKTRNLIGFLPEAPYFYGYLSGKELVRFYARLSGVPNEKIDTAVNQALELVDMTKAADRRVKTYSKGMLQRIGVAQAIVHDPELIILDEPTAGIDPIGSAAISESILEMKRRGKTVVLCSHLLGQVENVCDSIAIMNKGKLVVSGRLEDVLTNQNEWDIHFKGDISEEAKKEIEAILTREGCKLENIFHPRSSLEKFFIEKFSTPSK